ncbi:P-II family nitrogen regulator [Cyanobium sp. N5-Cardenillas]|jgi:nitrogen regulatory protein PII|uniref:P-II family nitrogen regulator n=1 Tax=Cyanobium sp. N5-Cardenillas TaxID=2823720 RepID=UPI0020CC4E40|nr:transcriptional regulator [Cyanobium sp. N5-Cardenillas]MCP9786495.1 transcriptional regulator [Cyanobium sp. N5-Cardenillas]
MKRIDLFLSERELNRVCKAITAAGAKGYSVMRHVTGMGPSGEISEGMDFSGLGANAHVIVFVEDAVLAAVSKALKPLLKRYGGVGFVSSADPL